MSSLNILDIVLIATSAILITASSVLTYLYLVSRSKVRSLMLDKAVLMVEFSNLLDKQQTKPLEETEGFLKFVSESRDWAFQYIEDVQAAIEEYRVIADVIPISKDMSVEQAEKLSATYDRLMTFLPDENLL
jgi:hypothetical protein